MGFGKAERIGQLRQGIFGTIPWAAAFLQLSRSNLELEILRLNIESYDGISGYGQQLALLQAFWARGLARIHPGIRGHGSQVESPY